MRVSWHRALLTALLVATVVSSARGDVTPLGDPFLVNSFADDRQYGPAVAVTNAAGDFVVLWQSYDQDGDGMGIFGQRYAGDGTRLGDEFQVNEFTTGSQVTPAVAVDGAGNFVVVWQSDDYGEGGAQDGSYGGIFGRRYANDGTPLG